MSEGGKRRRSFTRPGAPADDWENEHVDEISMYLEITDPKARHTDGEKTYVPVDADLVMTNPEVRTTPDMLGIKLLGTSSAGAALLRDLMAKTCFRLPMDCDDDHSEERRERLEAEAEEIADVLVKGPNEALSRALAKIAEREIGTARRAQRQGDHPLRRRRRERARRRALRRERRKRAGTLRPAGGYFRQPPSAHRPRRGRGEG